VRRNHGNKHHPGKCKKKIIAAAGIWHGLLKGEEKGIEICGEKIEGKIESYIFSGAGADLRFLLDCLYALEKSGILPYPGGLASQPAVFADALKAWNHAPGIFARQRERLKNIAKRLGAYANVKQPKHKNIR
jgi:hypothetical protein